MHEYHATITWTPEEGQRTTRRDAYTRDHDIAIEGKPTIAGSSDPNYRGDASRHNPEDLLVASASACHMLWYLHLCANAGVIVVAYRDEAIGRMEVSGDGAGQFEEILLRPRVTITAASDPTAAQALHSEASEKCFIARSLSCPVRYEPEVEMDSAG